ncbi:MAG: 2-C-methyl-D-erythritol 4-phosphate cytidylyltransferase [Rubrobacter sp.]|nr:2-C-methyl-D-erythritol 4-phosphate cytidylyltransferase [Rubrobacter sp.]
MGRPKQFIDLLGSPALLYALRAFEEASDVARIYTVGDRARIEDLVEEAGINKYAGCALPGESRSLSARSGLSLLDEDSESMVLVHDGSRCLVTASLIQRIVAAALRDPSVAGVVPVTPVSDTIKSVENGIILQTLDRAKLYAAQTPQAFRLGLLRKAYADFEEHLRVATDDAYLIERAGGRVLVVAGEKSNIKLTTPEDLTFAEALLYARHAIRS